MTSDRRLPDWASAVAGMAPAILTVGLVLGVAAMCIVGPRRAQALPSYARQTGQQCAACHNGFPELTPYGRQFKLNGYTFGGGDPSAIPPISAMTVPSFTHTEAGQPGGAAPHFGPNDNFAVTGSLFYGGRIADNLGAFAQGTYDGVTRNFNWDNLDIRYARSFELFGHDTVVGTSFNNNPTVNDVWNSTPAWGYPYFASSLAPGPAVVSRRADSVGRVATGRAAGPPAPSPRRSRR